MHLPVVTDQRLFAATFVRQLHLILEKKIKLINSGGHEELRQKKRSGLAICGVVSFYWQDMIQFNFTYSQLQWKFL